MNSYDVSRIPLRHGSSGNGNEHIPIKLHGSTLVFPCCDSGPGPASKRREKTSLFIQIGSYFAFSVPRSKNQCTYLHLYAVNDRNYDDKETKNPQKVQIVLQHHLLVLHSSWKSRISPASKGSWEMHPPVVSTADVACFFPPPRGALLIPTAAQMGFLRMRISRMWDCPGSVGTEPG